MDVISQAQILLLPISATSVGLDSVALAAIINGGLAIIIGLIVVLFCRRVPLFNKQQKNALLSKVNQQLQFGNRVNDIPSNGSYLDSAIDSKYLVNNTFVRWFQIRIMFIASLLFALVWPWSGADRQKTAKRLGSHFAIYFFFSQMLIYAFAAISIFSLATLLPVHLATTDRSFFVPNNVTVNSTLAPNFGLPICYGVDANTTGVCNSHGTCDATNVCTCEPGYLGLECEAYMCFDKFNYESLEVCSGHGACLGPNECKCDYGYIGNNCSIPTCNSLSGSNACSAHGQCVDVDKCECNTGYVGTDCQNWQCFNTSNVDPTVCNGHGTCSSVDTCQCKDGYVGDRCQFKTCFSVVETNPNVCNGNGQCSGIDVCTCNPGYAGNNCALPQCGATNITAGVHGACALNYQCQSPQSCNCTMGVGQNGHCNEPVCGPYALSSGHACSGHGVCNGPNVCLCEGGYYGTICEKRICFGWGSDHTNVCYGRGTCTGYNQCACNAGYSGFACQDTICFGHTSAQATVCGGNGQCSQPNVCTCKTGYNGTTCTQPICNGLDASFANVCGGNGHCIAPNQCQCNNGFVGANCDSPVCNMKNSTDPSVCNGNGVCVAPHTCACANGFSGTYCDIPPATPAPSVRQVALAFGNAINVLGPDNSIAEYTSSRVAGDWVNSWANVAVALAIGTVVIVLLIICTCCLRLWMTSKGKQPMEPEFVASPYVLEISGIDTTIINNDAFKNMMIKINNNESDVILKTSLVLDLAKPTRLWRKLEKVNSKLEHFELKKIQKQIEPMTHVKVADEKGNKKCSFEDAITYFRAEKIKLEAAIKEWDKMYKTADRQIAHIPVRAEYNSAAGLQVIVDNAGTATSLHILNFDEYIQGTGYGFVMFNSVKAKHVFLDRFKKAKTMMLAKSITYESDDINWESFYNGRELTNNTIQHKRRSFTCGQLMSIVLVVLLLALWAVPIAVASAYQSIVDLAPLQSASDAARGVLGGFLLQYLPTFALFVACMLGVRFISSWSRWESRTTYGHSARVSTVRSYVFLILAMLIVPLITIAVSDAIFIGPIANSSISMPTSLQQLFIPSTAVFFMTLIMHWTFIKNLLDGILASQLVRSLYNNMWFMTPSEKLNAHRVYEIKLDQEYAHLLAVTGTALCLSVTSPLILPIAFGYILIKYFVDRFNAEHAHYHGRFLLNREEESADYMTQRKTVQMLAGLVMVNLIIFFGFLSFYFGFKLQLNMYYLPHLIIVASVAALLVLFLGIGVIIVYFRGNVDYNIAEKNTFDPSALLFETAYDQPRLDEHGREKRREYLAQQQLSRMQKMRSLKVIDVEYMNREFAGLSPSIALEFNDVALS